MCCSCMHHLLPWVASCSFVMHHTCLCTLPCHAYLKSDMHHTWLCIMPCYVLVVYYVVCFFSVLLLRVGSIIVAFVRTRSTTSVCLLHGLVLLPCGISGKMTIPSKSLLSLIASCSLFCYAALPTTCLSSLPNCHEPLTFVTLPSKPLFGYVTALLSPSYSIVSCRWRLKFVPCWNMFICWDITISLI